MVMDQHKIHLRDPLRGSRAALVAFLLLRDEMVTAGLIVLGSGLLVPSRDEIAQRDILSPDPLEPPVLMISPLSPLQYLYGK